MIQTSFLDTCSFNHRLEPDQTWSNFSGPVCSWSCGVRWEGGTSETGFAAKTGGILIFTPQLQQNCLLIRAGTGGPKHNLSEGPHFGLQPEDAAVFLTHPSSIQVMDVINPGDEVCGITGGACGLVWSI